MILGNPYLFCRGNGNVELWKNSGSYENGAGQEHSDATHIRAHTNHAISQISPPERLEVLMQEVFSKTTDPNVPLQEQEYFELRLDDLGTPFRPKFIDSLGAVVRHRFPVCEAQAAWSEIDRNIMWDGFEHDEYSTLHQAELRYEERRAAMVEKGFIHSDMEF
jgi:hypothetical protein